MVLPGLRLAPTPPLSTPFVLRNRRLGVGRAGKPAGCHALDGLSKALGLFGLGGGVGGGRLLSQLAGGHDEKPELFDRASSIRVCHCYRADDTHKRQDKPWISLIIRRYAAIVDSACWFSSQR